MEPAVELNERQKKWLKELEDEFSDRYDENSKDEYNLRLKEEDFIPPTIENWVVASRDRYRGGDKRRFEETRGRNDERPYGRNRYEDRDYSRNERSYGNPNRSRYDNNRYDGDREYKRRRGDYPDDRYNRRDGAGSKEEGNNSLPPMTVIDYQHKQPKYPSTDY